MSLTGLNHIDAHRLRVWTASDEMEDILDIISASGGGDHTQIIADIEACESTIATNAALIATKADSASVYTKSETDTEIATATADTAAINCTVLQFEDIDNSPAIIDTLGIVGGDSGIAITDSQNSALIDADSTQVTVTPLLACLNGLSVTGTLTSSSLNTALAGKADQAAMTTALGLKADQAAMTTALAAKCNDSRVLTDVPSGAVFTDTLPQIKILGSYIDFKQLDFQDCFVGAGSAPDEYGIIPSPQLQNVVGLSAALNAKVPSSSVLTNVPANALFTDTALQLYETTSSTFVSASKLNFKYGTLAMNPALGSFEYEAQLPINNVTNLQSLLDSKVGHAYGTTINPTAYASKSGTWVEDSNSTAWGPELNLHVGYIYITALLERT